MSKKKIYEYNNELIPQVDKIYFHKTFEVCLHKQICLDKRDELYKCTSCFTVFLFNKANFKNFKKRIIKEFDFETAEKDLKKKIQEKENEIEYEEDLKTYYDLY
ncbi:hypothetical protein [Spiroplasma culicicola]|nr:hypothetical protein [Spiroplasma culicicola]